MRALLILVFILITFGLKAQQSILYVYDKANRLTQIIYPNQSRRIYFYDANGNRIQSNFVASQVCPGSAASFYAGIANATTYQWQVDKGDGTGYNDIISSSIYLGVNASTLTLTNPPTTMYGFICLLTDFGAYPET